MKVVVNYEKSTNRNQQVSLLTFPLESKTV